MKRALLNLGRLCPFLLVWRNLCGLGGKDKAFRLLEKSYQEHAATLPYLAIAPFWYGMHSDPHYIDLLRRMGLPQ